MSTSDNNKAGISTEAPAKPAKKKDKNKTLSVIMGIGMAFVVASIAWSTYIVGMGTDWTISSIIWLFPQATFAGIVMIVVFIKAFLK